MLPIRLSEDSMHQTFLVYVPASCIWGDIQFNHTPTCNNVRHLHLPATSPYTIQRILAMFPHLETIVVEPYSSDMSNPITNSSS